MSFLASGSRSRSREHLDSDTEADTDRPRIRTRNSPSPQQEQRQRHKRHRQQHVIGAMRDAGRLSASHPDLASPDAGSKEFRGGLPSKESRDDMALLTKRAPFDEDLLSSQEKESQLHHRRRRVKQEDGEESVKASDVDPTALTPEPLPCQVRMIARA